MAKPVSGTSPDLRLKENNPNAGTGKAATPAAKAAKQTSPKGKAQRKAGK